MNYDKRAYELMMHLLLCGGELSKTNLIYTLSELSDVSGISGENDFEENTLCKEYTATVLFVNSSVEFFIRAKKDLNEYDNWLLFFKEELLKIENYELVKELNL